VLSNKAGKARLVQEGVMIARGRVSWFKLNKKFGFIELDGAIGDAFLHVSVLKAVGYVSVPAGTTMRVEIEQQQGRRRVIRILEVDISTALSGEPAPVFRKLKNSN
jgi:CspA family cold shock protein